MSDQAEMSLLAACLAGPDAFSVLDAVRVSDFENVAHRACWGALRACAERGERLDAVNVGAEMAKDMPRVIGRDGVTVDPTGWLLDAMTSTEFLAAHIGIYAERVATLGTARRASVELASVAHALQSVASMSDLVETSERLRQLAVEVEGGSVSEVPERGLQLADTMMALETEATRDGVELSTGLASLDERIGGLTPGYLHTIAARPGVGKTSLALHIAKQVALQDRAVLFFSLESTADRINRRQIAAEIGEPVSRLPELTRHEVGARLINAACRRLECLPMSIVDTMRPVDVLAACARRWAAKVKDPGLVVLDYVQIVPDPQGFSGRSENEQLTARVGVLKRLAKDLRIPVLMLSQLNRANADGRPKIGQMRGSGSIEQESDVVILPHREGSDEQGANERMRSPGVVDLIVGKNKDGQTGTVKCWWEPTTMSYRDATEQEIRDADIASGDW